MKRVVTTFRLSNWLIVLIFIALAIFLRIFSFFPSVIDHDESTYLEISRQMLNGKTLYVDMIDIKPPGIFLIIAGFQAVFGYSIFVIRLLVAIWIGFTAFMIFLTGKALLKDNKAAFSAGIIYVFFISTWSFYGISITPEIFFNLFTITSLYLLLKLKSIWKYMLAGLIAGIGFIVKYFVLLDFSVFILFFLLWEIKDGIDIRKSFRVAFSMILSGVGLILPFALINLYYYTGDHFDSFVNIIYQAPRRYPTSIHPVKMPLFILDLQLRFFPIFFFYYYSLFSKVFRIDETRQLKLFLVIWSLASLVGVIISGNHYGHYTIQLMLPVSLTAGLFFHSERAFPGYLNWINNQKVGVIILAGLLLLISSLKLEYVIRRDMPREIANYMKPILKQEDVIYTGNYHHILYYLLKKDSPTPYIHRSLLQEDKHMEALNIDQQAEFESIIKKGPAYILTQKEYPEGQIKEYITSDFELEKDFGNTIRLYRRIK